MALVDLDLWQKRDNPLVDLYVTTDYQLETILKNAPESKTGTGKALLYIQESLAGKRLPTEALEAAQAAPIKRSNPELLILMLAGWAELACRVGRTSEAEALLERANVLISTRTHPVVKASALFAESVFRDTTGNKAKCEEILRDIVGFLPTHCARRKYYVWELGLFLAQQGRGVEFQQEIRELSWQCNDQFKMLRVLMVQFVDAVETGHTREASLLMSQIAHDITQIRKLARMPWRYQTLLKLMQECITEKDSPLAQPQRLKRPPAWLKVLYSLMSRNTEDALSLARQEASRLSDSVLGAGFESLNLIRAELAAGKWEGAKRLLKMRQERGNAHYLDDFFYARVELLADNKKAASRHFAAVLNAIDHYRARGRLDFELRLACELSQGDIVLLTQSAAKISRRASTRTSVRRQESPPEVSGGDKSPRRSVNLIIGRSTAIAEIRQAIIRFANLKAPVLVMGETGTGKDLVARALHDASKRKRHRYIPVNCGSITETLLESELFGHERGAFTGADKANKGLFEEAGHGTIFLDEIGSISPALQKALLRVMETGEIRAVGSGKTRKINCRILAATNADLAELAETGGFRKDMLYRLQRLGLYIPPLRERSDDIMMLSRHFLDIGRAIGTHAHVAKDLRKALETFEWPGNVRQLKNVIERMRLMNSDKLTYTITDLDIDFQPVNTPSRNLPQEPVQEPQEYVEPADQAIQTAPAMAPQAASIDAFIKGGTSSVRRIDRLRELFTKYEKLTRSEIIKILGVSPNTATKDLKTLCDEGLVERIEPSASTRSHYFVLKKADEPVVEPAPIEPPPEPEPEPPAAPKVPTMRIRPKTSARVSAGKQPKTKAAPKTRAKAEAKTKAKTTAKAKSAAKSKSRSKPGK
jgi:DNA-binding NtrC family response regulator